MSGPVRAVPAAPDQVAAFRQAARITPLPGFTVRDMWGSYTPVPYLVKHLLGPAQVTTLFGESGHFKSVIAIDLAMCVSTGRQYHGLRTARAGVLYVAGEGHGGLRKRIRAWLLSHGHTETDEQPLLYVTSAGANLISNPEQLQVTVEHAAGVLEHPIGLVILDTLSANLGPGDVDKSMDTEEAKRNARLAAPEAAILFVHHTGHADKQRERGSYNIIAFGDYRLQAIYDEPSKLVTLKWLKEKDDEKPQPLVFSWEKVALGWKDEDDEELSSVILSRSEEPAPAVERERSGTSGLGANQETVLKVLKRLYRTHRENVVAQGRDAAQARVFMSGLRGAVVGEKRMNKDRFREAVNALKERGLVREDGTFVYLSEGE